MLLEIRTYEQLLIIYGTIKVFVLVVSSRYYCVAVRGMAHRVVITLLQIYRYQYRVPVLGLLVCRKIRDLILFIGIGIRTNTCSNTATNEFSMKKY